ncbi:MAG TPA: hypothetical protein VN452_02745, partial [Longilinea sp.]|nr:hypothetical protein [Longilinea sp.]
MTRFNSKEKKLTKKQITLGVLLILGLFALAAWFRSYIIHQPFLDNLYFLLAGTIKELWKFVTTPTVFIALVILSILFWNKEK